MAAPASVGDARTIVASWGHELGPPPDALVIEADNLDEQELVYKAGSLACRPAFRDESPVAWGRTPDHDYARLRHNVVRVVLYS